MATSSALKSLLKTSGYNKRMASEAKYGLAPIIPPPPKKNTPSPESTYKYTPPADLSGIPGYSAPGWGMGNYSRRPPTDISGSYPSAEAQLNQAYGAGNWFMNLGPDAPGGGDGGLGSGDGGAGGGEAAAQMAKFNES